jgi:hypothetical protein
VVIKNSQIERNFGGIDALIIAKTNTVIEVDNTSFIENRSNGRGSVVLADLKGNQVFFRNSVFKRNYSI